MLSFALFDIVLRMPRVPWRHVIEHMGRLKGLLLKLSLVVTGYYTTEHGLAAVHFARHVRRLSKGGGHLHCSLYMKQCGALLMRYYASSSIVDMKESFPVSVSLTRTGLPRIIPSFHRKIIRRRDKRADYLVRLYLSFFSISKIILLAKPVSRELFSSMERIGDNLDLVKTIGDKLFDDLPRMCDLYCPWIKEIPLNMGFSWVPTWKSLPNSPGDKHRSCFTVIHEEIDSFLREPVFVPSDEGGMDTFSADLGPLAALWFKRLYYPFDEYDWQEAVDLDQVVYCDVIRPYLEDVSDTVFHAVHHRPGRLAQVLEGAGKRRVFAICNYMKQRLLYPVHEWAMKVLRRFPSDGTYHQSRPLDRLASLNRKEVFSFDLKSATDRWPLSFIESVVEAMFGIELATPIVYSALGGSAFDIGPPGFPVRSTSSIVFATGQPLGFYSSWALFALSHHISVWLAAERADPQRLRPFWDYALLGDDIVIADKAVALEYEKLVGELGVTISRAKSLVSDCGCFEFAKQFRKGEINLSPVSALAIISSPSPLAMAALADKYQMSYRTLVRFAKGGYRVRSKARFPKTSKWKRLLKIYQRTLIKKGESLDWWIGGFKPINPYIKGVLLSFLLEKMRPKNLVLPPSPGVVTEDQVWWLEVTLYQSWTSQWLKWLLWHTKLAMEPDPSFSDLLDAPICATTWARNRQEPDLIKYGLLWRMVDMYSTVIPPLPLGWGKVIEEDEISGGFDGLPPVPDIGVIHLPM
jgi:hypothetical protein